MARGTVDQARKLLGSGSVGLAVGLLMALPASAGMSGEMVSLEFATGPEQITLGACSSASFSIVALDALRTPVTVGGAPFSITLLDTADGDFFSDAECTQRVASVEISAGSSKVEFFYRASLSGPVRLNGVADRHLSATWTLDVSPAIEIATVGVPD